MAVDPEFGPRDAAIPLSSYQDYYVWVEATGVIESIGRASFSFIQNISGEGRTATPGRADPRLHAVDLGDVPNLIDTTSLDISIADNDGFAPHETTITITRPGVLTVEADGDVLVNREIAAGTHSIVFHWAQTAGTRYRITIEDEAVLHQRAVVDALVVAPAVYTEAPMAEINVPITRGVIDEFRGALRNDLRALLQVTPDDIEEIKEAITIIVRRLIAEDILNDLMTNGDATRWPVRRPEGT